MSNVKLLAVRTPLYGLPDCGIGVPHVALEGVLGVVSHKTVIIGFVPKSGERLKICSLRKSLLGAYAIHLRPVHSRFRPTLGTRHSRKRQDPPGIK
jgi:hypothetical protein